MADNEPEIKKPFKLDFSNRAIEHLGVKLYQNKPTNVISEYLSNCWDADATKVEIDLNAGSSNGHPNIVISDDGRGMTRDELTDNFLVIGLNRRTEPKGKTPQGRSPMGRKGIGKLAGFGIARTIDILSTPNPKLRKNLEAKDHLFYWLRFSLDSIGDITNSLGAGGYAPTVIADGIDLNSFSALVEGDIGGASYAQFLMNAKSGGGGVVVRLSDTTLMKQINPHEMLKSLGRRFTVAMLRPDFVVKVNSKVITPQDALPPLQDFGFGDCNNPIEEKAIFAGEERTMRYWVRFVSLKGEEWPIENAGVGVYAHGKIAQDRPFFFGVKGKEIFSRYLYGVVEADWLDELAEDVISTDRRSVNWEMDATAELHKWGEAMVSSWVEGFRKWRISQPKKHIVDRIRKVSPAQSGLSGGEEDALAELLSEVLPNLGNDEDAKDKTTKSFTDAWAHTPTRELTKALWKKAFETSGVGHDVFPAVIEQLRESMVPESMGLAVTMAQRIAAITAMGKLIETESTETSLQRLIETFPWLLEPRYERLTANQTIKTLVTDKHTPDTTNGQWSLKSKDGSLKPDFVFLSDPGTEKEIVVFELKGPECGKTLQPVEYEQLHEYLRIIRGVYSNRNIRVTGILVGHETGGFDTFDDRITVRRWSEVWQDARKLHVSYLVALLQASDPKADDLRLRQIADFGGKETLELVGRLGSISEPVQAIVDILPKKT